MIRTSLRWMVAMALVGLGGAALAQSPEPVAPNVAYVELGGPGLLYSVNYERAVHPRLGLRAGLSRFVLVEQGTDRSMGATLVPLTASTLAGGRGHSLEAGLGATVGALGGDLNVADGVARDRVPYLAGVAQLGYRYQPVDGGLVLRATFTPMVTGQRFMPLGTPYTLWGGISAGWAF